MLQRMKPLPRFILIAAIVGGVGFGLSKVDFASFKKAEPVTNNVAVEAPTVTTVTPGQAPSQPAQVQAAPATEAPAPLQPAQNNSGLDAVLNAGKK